VNCKCLAAASRPALTDHSWCSLHILYIPHVLYKACRMNTCAILKAWCHIKNLTPFFLFEEMCISWQSCQISSWSDLKRQSLGILRSVSPNMYNKDRINSNMGWVPEPKMFFERDVRRKSCAEVSLKPLHLFLIFVLRIHGFIVSTTFVFLVRRRRCKVQHLYDVFQEVI